MPRTFLQSIDLGQLELQNARIQNLGTAPSSPVPGQIFYNTTLNQFGYWNGTSWVYGTTVPDASAGVKGIVQLAGDLAGTAAAPVVANNAITSAKIADGTIVDGDVATANKDGLANVPSLRTLGTTGTQAAAGNDSRLSDSRAPSGSAGGSLAGTYPNPSIAANAVSATEIAGSLKPSGTATAGTEALRALGTTAGTAAAGNDARLSDSRAPSGAAGGSLTGSYPNPGIAAGAVTATEVSGTLKPSGSAAAGTEALRALGTTATTAAAGNDSRLSDARTPTGAAGGMLTGTFPNPSTAPLNSLTAPTGAVSLNSQKITNLADPTNAQDAATKAYVDGAVQGVQWKVPVIAASTANLNLAAPGTAIDGVTLTAGDRVLVKDQTTQSQNGIYIFQGSATPMTRATDADTATELRGATVNIEQGTQAGRFYNQTADNITVGTTALTFVMFQSASDITGDGVTTTRSGNTLSTINATDAAAGGVGTFTSGAVGVARVRRAIIVGNGALTSFTTAHGLGTAFVSVDVIEVSSGAVVETGVVVTSSNVTINFDIAPVSNKQYAVVMTG